MGNDRRDGAGGQVQVRRIPVPPPAQSPIDTPGKGQTTAPKNRGPSPQRRTPCPSGRAKDASSILCSPGLSVKRHEQTPSTKISKTLLRRSPPQAIEKDDVPERDSSQKPTARRESASKDSGHRRASMTSESSSSAVNSKNLVRQLSALVKSTRANPSAASGSGTSSTKPTLAAVRAPAAAVKAPAPAAAVKAPASAAAVKVPAPAAAVMAPAPAAAAPAVPARQPVRSTSVCRDRLGDRLPGDTRSSMLRRSASVGKGRAGSAQPDQMMELAGAKSRPVIARSNSATAAPPPARPAMRDASAGRLRPVSAKSEVPSLHSSSKLTTITEAPARPPPAAIAAAALQTRPNSTPSRPVLSLNLAALKQQPAAPSLPSAGPTSSACSTEDSGPPVPKLDLGGILQRRAEEQASEPVFVVAPSTEEEVAPPALVAQNSQIDKRKSITQLPSATEEPAEHFYLYPKVNPQEKKRIEDICKVVPKRQQAAITDLFGKMVEARQNCEQMCFRGHRLLDQAQAEFKNRLALKEEEVAQTKEEAMQWRQEAEFLRTQLALLLGARQPEEYMDEYSPAPGQIEQRDEGEASATGDLRNSLLTTFDRIALLGSGASGAACNNNMQEYADG